MSTCVAYAPPGVMPEAEAVDAPEIKPEPTGMWSDASASLLQETVDRVFGTGTQSLPGLDFSFTIADPSSPECPLIGCSSGFTELCGYKLSDIVGHNCRFLVDPVPVDMIDKTMRKLTKDFCQAVQDGEPWMPPSDYAYAPTDLPLDELVGMQTNARKDGTLFNNLYYMKVFWLGAELGEEQPYIVALQSELKGGKQDFAALANNLGELDEKMDQVKDELCSMFFVECSLSRPLFKPRRPASAF